MVHRRDGARTSFHLMRLRLAEMEKAQFGMPVQIDETGFASCSSQCDRGREICNLQRRDVQQKAMEATSNLPSHLLQSCRTFSVLLKIYSIDLIYIFYHLQIPLSPTPLAPSI
jgi:hypothetical protein